MNYKKFCRRDYGKDSLEQFQFDQFKIINNNILFINWILVNNQMIFLAISAQVISKEVINGWVKFRLLIRDTFNRNNNYFPRRGEQSLWISSSRVLCNCPRIKVGRQYLVLGWWLNWLDWQYASTCFIIWLRLFIHLLIIC